MEIKTNCRSYFMCGGDPFYVSNVNWMTLLQWKQRGYKLDEYLVNMAISRCLCYAVNGYTSPYCRSRCTRYHRRVMRKVK